MVVCKICKAILLCWVMHIFVMAEDVTVSVNTELNSAAINSKASSEKLKIPALITSNNNKEDAKMKNSPQDTSQNSKDFNKDDKNAGSNAEVEDIKFSTEEEGTKFKIEEDIKSKTEEQEDPLDEAYRECKGYLSCVEQRMVTLIDRLDAMKSIPIFEGYVTIEKTAEEVPEEDVTEDSDVALLSRIDSYLRSHSIRAHIPETEGDIPLFPGRVLQEKFLDFSLGTLATNDSSEGQ